MAAATLLFKLLLAPLLVVASSMAGRRWGPRVAGILVCLPIVAGPILLIIWLEHGTGFAARAAGAATLGVVPLAVFAVVIGFVAGRHGWLVTMLAAWASVLIVDVGLVQVRVPAAIAFVVAVLALHGAGFLLRRIPVVDHRPPAPPWWDLPARALATGLLVVIVTGSAAALGPVAAGVLAPFPIALSVVCGFAVAHGGRPAVLGLLRGIVPGLDGFALFCVLVALLLEPLGAAGAFAIATGAALIVAGVLAARRPRAG